MGHEPGGGSPYEILHHVQDLNSGGFNHFNYGIMRNIQMYNSTQPPIYNVSRIRAPTILIYGDTDTIAVEPSVMILAKNISNLHRLIKVPCHSFNHMDFLYRINAKEVVYDPLITLLKSH